MNTSSPKHTNKKFSNISNLKSKAIKTVRTDKKMVDSHSKFSKLLDELEHSQSLIQSLRKTPAAKKKTKVKDISERLYSTQIKSSKKAESLDWFTVLKNSKKPQDQISKDNLSHFSSRKYSKTSIPKTPASKRFELSEKKYDWLRKSQVSGMKQDHLK